MNLLTIENNKIVISPKGLDKIWSFTNRIEISIENISSVTIDKNIIYRSKGLRLLGLATFNKWAGTFIYKKEKYFWNVTSKEIPLVIQLHDEKFKTLIIGVDDATEWENKINCLIAQ